MNLSEFVWAPQLIQTLIAAVLSGSVVGIIVNWFVQRRLDRERGNRAWKEAALSTLLGPLVMHLIRTDALSHLYQSTFRERTRSFFHAQLMRESNLAARALLLANGHLLPAPLLPHAQSLIQHYDIWLARFDEKQALENPGPESRFDMGFVEVPFPVDARDAFLAEYAALRKALYRVQGAAPTFLRRRRPA
ncbi:MAG: hypothetical protein ACLGG6_00930 [Gammaproteobacteria bacterium]